MPNLTASVSGAVALLLMAAFVSPAAAQQQLDPVPLKNWPVEKPQAVQSQDDTTDSSNSTSGLIFIATTPCQ